MSMRDVVLCLASCFDDVVLCFAVVLCFDDVVLCFADVVRCFDDVMRSRHDVMFRFADVVLCFDVVRPEMDVTQETQRGIFRGASRCCCSFASLSFLSCKNQPARTQSKRSDFKRRSGWEARKQKSDLEWEIAESKAMAVLARRQGLPCWEAVQMLSLIHI